MLDREKFVKDLIRHLFWTKAESGYDTTAFETAENKEIANRAIDIARQQLPIYAMHNEAAIWQRCIELFRLGAYYFYGKWC